MSVCLWSLSCIYLLIYLRPSSVCLSVHPSVCLSVCVSVCLSTVCSLVTVELWWLLCFFVCVSSLFWLKADLSCLLPQLGGFKNGTWDPHVWTENRRDNGASCSFVRPHSIGTLVLFNGSGKCYSASLQALSV